MRAQAKMLDTSTHSLGECASVMIPGPKDGTVGIPVAANHDATYVFRVPNLAYAIGTQRLQATPSGYKLHPLCTDFNVVEVAVFASVIICR